MQLEELGWNAQIEQVRRDVNPELAVARVAVEHRGLYELLGAGARLGELAGRLRHRAVDRVELPAVGDWVLVREAGERCVIEEVLPRRSCVVRRMAGGSSQAQVIAANVDRVFIVTSANLDFNPRRIERYLALVWDSGAQPVVVLNKADLSEEVEAMTAELGAVALGVPVVAASAVRGEGLEALRAQVGAGETVAFVGSSGVGKSSLINRLLGDHAQRVSTIRSSDDRGRHTTTHRELLPIPGGGVLIDTPGMRELALTEDAAVESAFADIEALAESCRFRDCHHDGEPGCAVGAALEDGTLDAARYASYQKLLREQAHERRRVDPEAARRERQRWKAIGKQIRETTKRSPKC